jgi:hypothetical protein
MAYDINADSYPAYDTWGRDNYWLLPDWQKFYDELIRNMVLTKVVADG